MPEGQYLFDNAATAETGLRFAGLEATFDPSTIRYLSALGVGNGWSCWEIGAGSGSIAGACPASRADGKRPRHRYRPPVHPGASGWPAGGFPPRCHR